MKRVHACLVAAASAVVVVACGGTPNLTGSATNGGSTGGLSETNPDGGPDAGCAAPQTSCSGVCTTLANDPANCGSCDYTCASSQSCVAGSCACPTGGTFCAGACTSLQSDDHNCGTCAHACGAGQTCVAGVCSGGVGDAGIPDAGPDAGVDAGADAGVADAGPDAGATACTASNLTFAVQSYGAQRQPIAVAIGHLRVDAGPDVVVANLTSNSASVFKNNGAASFGPATDFPTGQSPAGAALGDVNGDGLLDLVVANGTDSTVGVLLGRGDGTFAAQVTYPVDMEPAGLALADFNNDGLIDVAVACQVNGVDVLLNQGDGGLGLETSYDDAGFSPYAVVAAKLLGSANLDLAVINGTNFGGFDVLPGVGNGTYLPELQVPDNLQGGAIVVADFNGDHKLDVAVTYFGYPAEMGNETVNELAVYLNKGNGTFAAPKTYLTVYTPFGLATGDVNGDGIPDLVTAETNANGPLVGNVGNVGIFLGDGTGGFASEMSVAAGQGLAAAAIEDLNGDGKSDIAVADEGGNALVVLLNQCP